MSREIPLTKGLVALVDDEDYDALCVVRWQAHVSLRVTYASRDRSVDGCSAKMWMHREIMRPGPGLVVDHINSNGLDNRRSNLRVCTQAQNLRNSRKPLRSLKSTNFKGIFWDAERGKWCAQTFADGRRVYIGRFCDESEAARAYDAAVLSLFGEFARLNFSEKF